MDMIKKAGRVIVRPDGREIEKSFIKALEEGGVKSIKADGFIRTEHPHCAFFKSLHSAGDTEFQRTTLYTPEGRLHSDCETGGADEPHAGKYVTKPEHLDILLFYLRDVEVGAALNGPEAKADCIEMPKTPVAELFSFVEKELFLSVMADYEIMAKHILNQLRRIYNEKLEMLSAKLVDMAEYAVFEDVPDMGVAEDLMERWHLYYIRKARLLREH